MALLRCKFDYGTFDVTTDIQANGSIAANLVRVFRKPLPCDPPSFDSTVPPGSNDREEGSDNVAARVTTWRLVGSPDS